MSDAPQALNRKTLIARLNEDLSREFQAVIAYVVYSQTLKGAQYMAIAKETPREVRMSPKTDAMLQVRPRQ